MDRFATIEERGIWGFIVNQTYHAIFCLTLKRLWGGQFDNPLPTPSLGFPKISFSLIFRHFLVTKKLMTSAHNKWHQPCSNFNLEPTAK